MHIVNGPIAQLSTVSGADGQVLTAGNSGKVPPGQVRNTGNVTEALQYFYHPDHLGSTSYVTDATGEVYQHLEYFAFGETFVEEHSNTDRTPYLFNGKELDEETGLYYYGARYYDARVSVWMSVDPLAEKYPAITPLAYVNNNPIVYIDPDGKRIDLSGLSASERKAYDAMISKLSHSKIFRAYYSTLKRSETTYSIKPGAGHGGSGSYNGKTKEVHSTQSAQVLAQELFHAYQDDLGVYTDKDRSVREAEADLVSASVAFSVGEPSMSYADWDQGIQFEYVDENLEFDEKVLSERFDEDFNKAVDARAKFYREREEKSGAKALGGYIQKNSKVGAIALKAIVQQVMNEQK